jgi:hypothetical protein
MAHEDIPMEKYFSDEQIISILREAEAGVSAQTLTQACYCRRHLLHLPQ